MRTLWLGAALCMLGCGDSKSDAGPGDDAPPPDAPAAPPITVGPWQAGSRILPTRYLADDGVVGFAGRRDSMLDLDCAFDRAPVTQGTTSWGFPSCPRFALGLFTDAMCQGDRVVLDQISEPVLNARIVKTLDGYFEVTDHTTATAYYVSPTSTCVPLTGAPVALATLRAIDPGTLPNANPTSMARLGDAASATSVVTDDGFSVITDLQGPAVDKIEASPLRLRARYRELDGAAQYNGLYDSQLDMSCEVFVDATGQQRCAGGLAVPAFASADCTGAPTYVSPSTYGVVRVNNDDPGSEIDHVIRCTPTTSALSIQVSAGVCMSLDNAGLNLCTGAQVDLSTLAKVSTIVDLHAPEGL